MYVYICLYIYIPCPYRIPGSKFEYPQLLSSLQPPARYIGKTGAAWIFQWCGSCMRKVSNLKWQSSRKRPEFGLVCCVCMCVALVCDTPIYFHLLELVARKKWQWWQVFQPFNTNTGKKNNSPTHKQYSSGLPNHWTKAQLQMRIAQQKVLTGPNNATSSSISIPCKTQQGKY